METLGFLKLRHWFSLSITWHFLEHGKTAPPPAVRLGPATSRLGCRVGQNMALAVGGVGSLLGVLSGALASAEHGDD